jgi:branched-chain amino acid transport system substrate-binding protein
MLLASACSGGDGGGRTRTPTPQVISELSVDDGDAAIIGVSASLGGAQTVGQDLADAVTLAVEDYGRLLAGHTVEVVAADDGCNDAEVAVEAATELLRRNALAVVGPMCGTGSHAANDEYEDAGILHITASATRSDLSKSGSSFFFRTAWRDDDQARVQAQLARNIGIETAIVVDDADPYGRTLADRFVSSFEDAGGRVVARERVQRGAKAFVPLARLILTANPGAVVYEGLDPAGGLLLRDLRAEGYEGVFIGPDSLFSATNFIANAGASAAEGAYLTAGPSPDVAFLQRFSERFGREPATGFVLQAYDAARVALTALDAAASEQAGATMFDRERLLDAMRTQTFSGLTGTMRFGEQGDRSGDTARGLGLAVYRVSGGVFEQVE